MQKGVCILLGLSNKKIERMKGFGCLIIKVIHNHNAKLVFVKRTFYLDKLTISPL